MKASWLCLPLAIAIQTPLSFAETVKDREGAVRKDRATMENDARWIYNDYQRGFAEAKKSGRPLLVVLRCVPCLACAGIDASVLTEPELAPLLDQFVCVRVINANTLDLSLFQFDYDLSFSTVFFNGDGTVYGRYGSWTHQKNSQDKTIAGYKDAMDAVLALHRGYPANQRGLAGKQGGSLPFKTPVEIPGLAGKYNRTLDWDGKVVQSCVHCHQIGDALRTYYRDQKKAIPAELVYQWPAPETIGLTLAPDRCARVEAVAAGSIAANAGLQPGDDLISLAGQPPVSIADISWVLHRAPDAGALTARVQRGGAEKSIQLVLPDGWRAQTSIAGRVGTWTLRAMSSGGLWLEDLPDEERTRRKLGTNEMALLVKHAGEYGKHAAAKKAGFKKGDVLVTLDGRSARITESELIGQLLRDHRPGDSVKAVILRGEERLDLSLPMQ